MAEPFSNISFNELWWQLVVPAGVIGSLVLFIFFLIFSITKENWKGKLFLMVLALSILFSEAINIHGYFWDLKYHAHIPEKLAETE